MEEQKTENRKIRVAVLVSGGGTNLQALINAEDSGVITSGEIVCVISSNAEAYALVRAKEEGIRTYVCSRRERKEDFEQEVLKILEEEKIGLIVLAGFLSILSPAFIRRYEDRIINVHPALIPSFCGKGFYGLKVHEAVLARGVKVTGATTHFVNDIPDGGKIIMQKAVEVKEDDTPAVLQKRVMEQAEWIILPHSVEKVCAELLTKKEDRNE